jgi:transposase-like protein
MTQKKEKKAKKEPDIIDMMLDQMPSEKLAGLTQDAVFGQGGLLKELSSRLLQRIVNAEMDNHLGYKKNDNAGDHSGDSRNGYTPRTVLTNDGSAEIQMPRDRNGTFSSTRVPKYQRRLPLFNDQVTALYGRGMSTRQIQDFLKEIYGVEISPDLVSTVTDAVSEDVKAWRSRPLEARYAVVYMDAIRIKGRQNGKVLATSVNVALGINFEGRKEVLGMWISENEGAKYWMNVLNELKNRGVKDILIACMDGLAGFPDAVRAVFPQTRVQLCIIHMIRNSLKFVSYKDRKGVCADLKSVYTAPTEEAAIEALEAFGKKWNAKYPAIYDSWSAKWTDLNEFFKYSGEIRKVIYTTNAIESLNFQFRKVANNHLTFPDDDAVRF